MVQGFTNSFNTLVGTRLAIGALEAPAFPANARAVTMWFPTKERGFATSVYITGQYLGTPMFAAILLWVAQEYGWRYVFYATGISGLLLGSLWYFIYQDPMDCKRANAQELKYIEEGGGLAANREKTKFDWTAVFRLLKYRQVLAILSWKVLQQLGPVVYSSAHGF